MENKNDYIYIFFKNGYICEVLDVWGSAFIVLIEEQMKIKGVKNITIATNDLMDWFINNGICENVKDHYNVMIMTGGKEYFIEERIEDSGTIYYCLIDGNNEYKIRSGKTMIIKNGSVYWPKNIMFTKNKYPYPPQISFNQQNEMKI